MIPRRVERLKGHLQHCENEVDAALETLRQKLFKRNQAALALTQALEIAAAEGEDD